MYEALLVFSAKFREFRMSKPPKPPISPLDVVQDGLELSARTLRDLIESLGSDLHGSGEHGSTIADVCRATTSLSTVAGELRARTKAAAKERDSLTPALVMEWLRVQPEEMKLHILRELSSSMDETSVLA